MTCCVCSAAAAGSVCGVCILHPWHLARPRPTPWRRGDHRRRSRHVCTCTRTRRHTTHTHSHLLGETLGDLRDRVSSSFGRRFLNVSLCVGEARNPAKVSVLRQRASHDEAERTLPSRTRLRPPVATQACGGPTTASCCSTSGDGGRHYHRALPVVRRRYQSREELGRARARAPGARHGVLVEHFPCAAPAPARLASAHLLQILHICRRNRRPEKAELV